MRLHIILSLTVHNADSSRKKQPALRQLTDIDILQELVDTEPAALSTHTDRSTWIELTPKKLSGCRTKHLASFVTEKETGDCHFTIVYCIASHNVCRTRTLLFINCERVLVNEMKCALHLYIIAYSVHNYIYRTLCTTH